MSYVPSTSFRQDYLPGITSLTDGRRSFANHELLQRNDVPCSYDEAEQSHSHFLQIDALWSTVSPLGPIPDVRSGQSIVYCPLKRSIISAYGRNADETYSSEFWRFSIDEQVWEKLPINDVTPRAGSGCALIDNQLWFFGGITSSSFVSDLHYVDLDTYEVSYPITTGDAPPPCAMPLVAYYAPYLIIWAGTSGSNLSSLHILDTNEMNWRRVPTDFVGRQGACGAIIDTTLYIFGASSPMTLLAFNLTTFEFSLIPTTGVEPPRSLECLTIVAVGDTLLAFETMAIGAQVKLYVFDTEKANWMSNSLTLNEESDQKVTPRAVFYIPDERKLFALCEGNEESRQPITELSIGGSIAALNHRLDLLSMIKKNN